MMSMFRPTIARSVTKRRKHAIEAKRQLARWMHLTTLVQREGSTMTAEEYAEDVRNARVAALLRAQAEIERALWLETGGTLGDEVSTPRRIIRRVVVTDGESAGTTF